MAILSALFTYLGRKIGSLVQAIFGWSITALFGRLPPAKQLAITVALALSVAWPVFVLGVIFPGVAGWVLAALPIGDWLSPTVLRLVWAGFALATPPIVGLLTRWAAPNARVSAARALVNGYPLALGYAGAFLVTAVTVPLVKLASAVRRFTDTHAFVQPRPGAYKDALRELALAAARAGVVTEVVDVPKRMTIATRFLTFMARGMVSALLSEDLKLLRGPELEIYLYPADLLLRGTPKLVAHVRAMMMRTRLQEHAYLVASEEAKQMQDELGRISDVLTRHEEDGQFAASRIESRLRAVYGDVQKRQLPFDEWVILDNLSHLLERRIVTRHLGDGPLPLDRVADELPAVTSKVHAELAPPARHVLGPDASVGDLVKDALETSKELAQLEIALAKNEVVRQAKAAARGAVLLAVGALCALMMLIALGCAVAMATDFPAKAALITGLLLVVVAGIATYVGFESLQPDVMLRTRERLYALTHDVRAHV